MQRAACLQPQASAAIGWMANTIHTYIPCFVRCLSVAAGAAATNADWRMAKEGVQGEVAVDPFGFSLDELDWSWSDWQQVILFVKVAPEVGQVMMPCR